MRKKVLLKRQARLEKRRAELIARSNASEDIAEVRAINEQLATIAEDLQDIADEIAALAEDENNDDGNDEGRNGIPTTAVVRGGNPVASYGQSAGATVVPDTRSVDDVLSSIEYRNAFAEYVKTGNWTYEQRDTTAGMVLTTDVGKIIPTTIMSEFIKELKTYGGLYAKVRKLNVAGGVEFPIEDLIPVVSWITETTPSGNQSAPELKTSVSFGYHIAEAKIAQSLLSQVVSLNVLENEIAKLLVEAFVKEFDRIIINGSGNGQPTGILNDARVKASNKITMAASDAEDWTKWRSKLFAKVPISYRAGGVLVMTVDTWEGLICTMKDANDRPLYSEVFDVVSGETIYRFNGKEVILVENDLGISDYSTASAGDVYMIYFKPDHYAINSNLQIGFKRYFNDDTNKWVNKGLCVMDGKLLDINGAFIIKK